MIDAAIKEFLREVVREELKPIRELLERQAKAGAGADLATVTKAARAVGLNPSTVRARYLARLTVHGEGRRRRISIGELRAVMREEAKAPVDLDAIAEGIVARNRSRH